MDRIQRKVILFRDISTIIFGLAGLVHQTVVASEANGILVTAFVTIIFGPTGAALLAQRSGTGQSTIEPSSGPQPSADQQR